jgi:hypothetical protein
MEDSENDTLVSAPGPKDSRFKPGCSGNLKGRPPGAKNRKKILEEIANEMHWVVEGDERRRRSTLELVLLSLRNRAIEGNVKAFRAVHELLVKYGPREASKSGGKLIVPGLLTDEEWIRRNNEAQNNEATEYEQRCEDELEAILSKFRTKT